MTCINLIYHLYKDNQLKYCFISLIFEKVSKEKISGKVERIALPRLRVK